MQISVRIIAASEIPHFANASRKSAPSQHRRIDSIENFFGTWNFF
jgi:hypothetical protein